MFTSNGARPAEPPKQTLLPMAFALLAIVPAVALPFLIKQPKEVIVAVYSAYVAMLAIVAAAAFGKRKKRGAAIAALVTCIVFTGLFVVYAYIAYRM